MCKNSLRGQIVLSLLNLQLEFAVVHSPGWFCCRGLLACTAAFLPDWINSLLSIVYHSGNLCFMKGSNITSLWDRRRWFLRSWLWWSDMPSFSVMLRSWANWASPNPTCTILPAASECTGACSACVFTSGALPTVQQWSRWKPTCVTWVEPIGLWSGREEGALGHLSLCPVVQEQQLFCGAQAGHLRGGIVLEFPFMGCSTMFQPLQWGHGDTDQVLQSGHRKCGRSEFLVLCLRFHRYVWERWLSLCGKWEASWESSFKGRAKIVAVVAGILYKQEWDDLRSHLTNIEEVGKLLYKRLKLLYNKGKL